MKDGWKEPLKRWVCKAWGHVLPLLHVEGRTWTCVRCGERFTFQESEECDV